MLPCDVVAGTKGAAVDKAKVAKGAAIAIAVRKLVKLAVVLAALAAVAKILSGRDT